MRAAMLKRSCEHWPCHDTPRIVNSKTELLPDEACLWTSNLSLHGPRMLFALMELWLALEIRWISETWTAHCQFCLAAGGVKT